MSDCDEVPTAPLTVATAFGTPDAKAIFSLKYQFYFFFYETIQFCTTKEYFP